MEMVRTAGMVQGTPDWQLDRAYETETAEMLEKVMADDDFPAYEVTDRIANADYHIGQAISLLCKAADIADEYGRAKELDELIERIEEFRCDMKAEKRRISGRAS